MIFRKHYLDFSYKYRLLVGDKLNGDIKYLIWKIYRRMVAREYLTKKCSIGQADVKNVILLDGIY